MDAGQALRSGPNGEVARLGVDVCAQVCPSSTDCRGRGGTNGPPAISPDETAALRSRRS